MSPFIIASNKLKLANALIPPPIPEKNPPTNGLIISFKLLLLSPRSFLTILLSLLAALFLYSSISFLFFTFVLSVLQTTLLQNYHFMSRHIPGTRQVRHHIRHIILSRRVSYDIPVFMTITPSERHSGLTMCHAD